MGVLTDVISNFQKACLDENAEKKDCWNKFFSKLLSWLVVTIMSLFLGQFLWNNFLVKAVAVLNPINNIIQMYAIIILFQLLSS